MRKKEYSFFLSGFNWKGGSAFGVHYQELYGLREGVTGTGGRAGFYIIHLYTTGLGFSDRQTGDNTYPRLEGGASHAI
jgi:hypothetical protein